MEQIEKDFINTYLSILAKEGVEICEEIFVMIGDKDELVLEKALACCNFFTAYKLDGVNTEKLLDRCVKFNEKVSDFHKYKFVFDKRSNDRRNDKILEENKNRNLDMGGMRLNGI